MKNKPKLLISASAIGYYKQGIVVDEDSPADGENFLSKVCFDLEKEAKKVSNEVKPVILRFGLILGDSGGIISNFLKFLKKGIKVKFGSGEQMMSRIHIDDLVRIIDLIISEVLANDGDWNTNRIPVVINCVAHDIAQM